MPPFSNNYLSNKLNATPALWSVIGPKGNLYLFGSIHLLPKNCLWLGPKISDLLAEADAYVGEVRDFGELMNYLSEQGRPGGKCFSQTPLNELLDQSQYNLLSRIMEGFGASREEWNYYKPWFAANVLINKYSSVGGFLPEYGIEGTLDPIVKKIDKNCFGLENPEFQLNIFDKLSLKTQLQFLKITIASHEQFLATFQILYDSWRRGDLDTLYNQILKPLMELKEYYEALFPNRHPSWVRQLEGFLQIPGDYFVVVGINHFIGPDSILGLLEKKGYSITRIQ